MLRLLSLLQTHRYWPGPELSDRLEVSPRTLRRDVDRLRELGYTVDAVRGAAGGYQLRAGGSLPPLLLEDEEAVAIAVGLRTAAAGAVGRDRRPVGAGAVQGAVPDAAAAAPADGRRRVADRAARPVGGRARRRRDGADDAWRRPAATSELLRFDYTAREAEVTPPPGRAVPPRLARPPVVPRRLGPRPAGLAQLPARPDRRSASPPASASDRATCRPTTRSRSCSRASAGCPSGTPYASGSRCRRGPRRAGRAAGGPSARTATGACSR